MVGMYISYTPRRQIGDWKAEWFTLIIMRWLFLTEFLGPQNNAMSGPEVCCSEGQRRDWSNSSIFLAWEADSIALEAL